MDLRQPGLPCVISGIVVALQSGGRWIDVPAEYGPRKTLYNRFVRWSAQGVWQLVFETLRRRLRQNVSAHCRTIGPHSGAQDRRGQG